MTTTTTVDTFVAANVRHYIGHTSPSTAAEWLSLTTTETIALLDGHESFTIDQLQTLTRHTGASFLQLVLTPGQLWTHQLRRALTKFENEGVGGDLADTYGPCSRK